MEPFNKGDHVEYIGSSSFWADSMGIVLNLSKDLPHNDRFINVGWYFGNLVDICFTNTTTDKYHKIFGAPEGIPFYPIPAAELKLIQKPYDPKQEPYDEGDI